MAKYINPVSLVEQQGTTLTAYDYAQARADAGADLLVVVVDRLMYKAAPIISNQADWDEFHRSYSSGGFVSFTPYRVPASVLTEAQP